MLSALAEVGRRIALHAWIAALGMSAIVVAQAWATADSDDGTPVAERVLASTVSGAVLGPELADASFRNDYPDLMRTVGDADGEVPLEDLSAFAILLALLLALVPGLVTAAIESMLSPRPGAWTVATRAALTCAWLLPLGVTTSAPDVRLVAASVAVGAAIVLAIATWPRWTAAMAARWALVVGVVWWAAPVAERIATAQPFAPNLGDVSGLSRLIESDAPPATHGPTDDWSDPRDSGLAAPRHVVVIAVDTLGATHASTNGYERPTLPTVAAMAEAEGFVFEQNYSSAPWTLPSTTSLFTSLHPHQHGVEDDDRRLHGDVVTLAGAFASQGWHTAALVTHLYVSSRFGLDSGFHEFWELSIDFNFAAGHQLVAEQLNDRVVPWLRRHSDEEFLLYVHYFDPHWDYEPPPPWDQRFTDPDYRGPADGTWTYMAPFVQTSRLMPERELAQCAGLYDGEIAYTDHHLGKVFDELRRLGIWNDTMVVVIADHGEELQEHASVGHARTVYDELLRVPLVIKPAGGRPAGWRARVSEQTRSIDVTPTLLEVAGLRTPPSLSGESLVPLMREEGAHRDIFARTLRHGRRHEAAVVHNRWKLIRGVRGREELFDLANDPEEQQNVIDEHPEIAADLRRRLEAVVEDPGGSGAGQRFIEDVDLSESEREALEALGYVQ